MQKHTIFGSTITLDHDHDEGEGILRRRYVAYSATMPDGAVFEGRAFSPAPHITDAEGIAAALALLGFLTIRHGEDDSALFEDYTPAQLAWSTSPACESMRGLVDEVIVLGGIHEITEVGIDQNGAAWTPFAVDYFAEQEAGECSICEREIEEGWLCLDDGSQEVCAEHIYFADAAAAKAHGYAWIGDPL